MPTLPSLPFYTWLAVSLGSLFLMGLALALVSLLARGLLGCLLAGYEAVRRSLWSLTGYDVLGLFALTSAGTAHWCSRRELRQHQLWNETGLPLGLLRGHTLREPRGAHLAVIAPPRAGKSLGVVCPVLEQFGGSALVIDLRGELHQKTATAREAYGPVYRFAPTEPGAHSCNINLLDAIRWGSPHQFGDVHRIADHLLLATDQATAPDAFAASAVPILMSVLVHCHALGEGSLPGVARWMLDAQTTLREKVDALRQSPDPQVQDGGVVALGQSDRMRGITWDAITRRLLIFRDPVIASHTTKSDMQLTELLDGVVPASLYLSFQFSDVARLQGFLGLFVECLVGLLGSPRQAPRHPVLLALDEVDNLGRLSELERAVSYLQGAGTQCLFVWQNVQQPLKTYGPDSPLLASISTKVAYAPIDVFTARFLSDHLGIATVTAQAVSPAGQALSETGRPLLLPDEVLRLAPEEALILHQGCAPIRARKLGSPPPPTRRAAVRQHVRAHRWAYATVGGVLVLALALWPLARTHQPSPGGDIVVNNKNVPARSDLRLRGKTDNEPLQVVTPTPAPTQAPPLSWVLMELTADTKGTMVEVERRRYATEAECSTGLQGRRWLLERAKQTGWSVTNVEDTPTSIRWHQSMPGVKSSRHGGWCRELAQTP